MPDQGCPGWQYYRRVFGGVFTGSVMAMLPAAASAWTALSKLEQNNWRRVAELNATDRTTAFDCVLALDAEIMNLSEMPCGYFGRPWHTTVG